jgi:hypothetical protein
VGKEFSNINLIFFIYCLIKGYPIKIPLLVFFITTLISGILFAQEQSKNYSYMDTTTESIVKRFDVFCGIGITPLKLNLGVGYFVTDNKEINIQYGSMFIPNELDIDVISIGMKFYEHKSTTVYSILIGATIQKNPSSLNGWFYEGTVGYLLETNIGFYFLPSIKLGQIFRKEESAQLIAGIDLSLGWYIK